MVKVYSNFLKMDSLFLVATPKQSKLVLSNTSLQIIQIFNKGKQTVARY